MEIVRTEMGLEPRDYALDERLKEIHYGHWQGIFAKDLPQHRCARDRRALARYVPLAAEGRRKLRGSDGPLRRLAGRRDAPTRSLPAMGASAACCAGTCTGSTRPRCRNCPCRRIAFSSCGATAWNGFNLVHAAGSPGGGACVQRERAGAAAAPALPRNVEWPLGAGCSDRQGAADVGHDRSRPVTHTLLATRDRRI